MTVVRILTRDTSDQMIRAGNSAAWFAREEKVKQADHFVCIAPGTRQPFFLAKVEWVGPVPESGPNRWALYFSRYTKLLPETFDLGEERGGQNPFVTLKRPLEEYLKVDYLELDWEEVEPDSPDRLQWSFSERVQKTPKAGLTIAEAKERLAESLGVRPDQVEIVIRG